MSVSGAELVTSAERLEAVCDQLCAEAEYGIDTEFHRERTYFPRLALIQLAWSGGVALIDPLAVDVAPLARVLDGDGVAVAHAGDQDLEVLERACGTVPRFMFDTQIAAGFLGMSTPSLSRLVEHLLDLEVPKSDRLTDWTRRPLTEAQVEYAAADVVHLVELRHTLAERLRRRDRLDWVEQECRLAVENRRTEPVPEEAWWRLRGMRQFRGRSRGVAQELAAWRERRAAELDIPARYVLSDMALSSIAHRPPRDREDLEAVRGIERRHLGGGAAEAILGAVQAGLALAPSQVRTPPEPTVDRTRRPAVALAAAWVGQLADDLDIDSALLATRADIADLLSGRPSRLDEGWRRQVVGEPLLRLAAGSAALAFDGRGGLVLEERSRRPVTGG
jgi:ribonuclease D